MRRTWLTGAASCLLLLTACSSVAHESGRAAPAGASPAASTPVSASPGAPTTSGSSQPGSNASIGGGNAGNGAEIVPMPASGGHFQSPSKNIVCEVYYQFQGLTHAHCQTEKPAGSVSMDATGAYQVCNGDQCLGNSGESTVTLEYGKAVAVGPFRCDSASTGVTCVVAGGKGFRISNAGITSAT
ncbi:hypothetical protein Val02_72790 [Virgisporangium aliadipatigenens]|uniref:Secreted protein n=1 Tax=Virgisporangium aliadipatigenens TaxID=741659 RepID=A0A8J3YVC1_9ACTN|nr:hypothetical protein [Virgisporangium aliadipatigenens]GIJ50393.1 hypothetical protein Val02_72790 [Virgisporangium aliadipatigenens]